MKLKTLIFCIIALLFTAKIVEAQAQIIDTIVNAGNYNLHFHIIKGNGVPIVFESGGGDDGSVWDSLLTDLHKSVSAPLITYDRAGFGKSGLDTDRLNITNEVQSLETGLKKLGFNKKYFLVAHSLGGSYSIVFAARNSDKVTGGVFIDINTPCFMTADRSKEIQHSYSAQLPALKKERPGVYFLLSNYGITNQRMAEAAPKITMPITVIGSDHPPYKGADSLIWKNCLRSFAMERPNRKYILAKNTSHYVFIQSQKLVVGEIAALYKKVCYK